MTSTTDRIAEAILRQALPATLAELFEIGVASEGTPDGPQCEFHEFTPHNLVLGEGARIVCSAIAFHNTAGGIFVFGAKDASFGSAVQNEGFNPGVFQWVVSNWARHVIPFKAAQYPHPVHAGAVIEVVLVPARRGAALLRLNQGFERFEQGSVLVRDGTAVVAAGASHFALLCGNRDAESEPASVTLPERLPPPWRFVGRDAQLVEMLQWFTQGERRRLFMVGPAGVGRSTLAAEFGSRLATLAPRLVLPGGAGLDYVFFLARDGLDPGPIGAARSARILRLSGLSDIEMGRDSDQSLNQKFRQFLAEKNGLVILDDGDPAAPAQERAADENLLVTLLGGSRHTKILYTKPGGSQSVLDQSMTVPGFVLDAEYREFGDICCARFGVAAPNAVETLAIARWTGGVPRLIEAVFETRRDAPSYADAIRMCRRPAA